MRLFPILLLFAGIGSCAIGCPEIRTDYSAESFGEPKEGYVLLVIFGFAAIAFSISLFVKEYEAYKEKQASEEWEYHEGRNQQLSSIVAAAIMDVYAIPSCPHCNDTMYNVLKFNPQYTGMQIECKTCSKKVWLKTDVTGGGRIKEAYDTYYDEVTWGYDPTDSLVILATPSPKQSDSGRHSIPKKVKQEVWQRDGGKCVECGSKENLEYDHIIPMSKGGSNTTRNIQLLCESCNRKKSGKIE